jgi:hypothetical protein
MRSVASPRNLPVVMDQPIPRYGELNENVDLAPELEVIMSLAWSLRLTKTS